MKQYLLHLLLYIWIGSTGTLFAQRATFDLDRQGFVRNWYNSGLKTEPYTGPYSTDNRELWKIKQDIYSNTPLGFPVPDGDVSLSSINPEIKLSLLSMGENVFVENAKFHYVPTLIRSYSLTELTVENPVEAQLTLMAEAGGPDLWCNGEKIPKKSLGKEGRYNLYGLRLSLKKGANTVFVRQIDLAARDHRCHFALRVDTPRESVKVTLPGDQQQIARFFNVEKWLYSITSSAKACLQASTPPEVPVEINFLSKQRKWGDKMNRVEIKLPSGDQPINLTVRAKVGEAAISRRFLFASSDRPEPLRKSSYNALRNSYIDRLLREQARMGFSYVGQLLLKLSEKFPLTERDYSLLDDIFDFIGQRKDCSDFHLAFLLRLYMLKGDKLDARYVNDLKNVALNFRYWTDEEGRDAMWFWSENHRILFHSSQMIAGLLFPEERFSASQRTGKEQAEIGSRRVEEWITELENFGSDEFQSINYLNVTVLGMLNVIDFASDETLKKRMTKLLDMIFRRATLSTFDGVCLGVQGRVYDKGLMNLEKSEKQALLFYAMPNSYRPAYDLWTIPLMTSTYQIPIDLEKSVSCELDTLYADGGAEVCIHRRTGYFLSSMNIPSSVENATGKAIYVPGKALYQQHLWEAALSARARVFVTHPGSTNEFTSNRPGYWGGNSIAPTLRMKGNLVVEIFNTPVSHPYQFTHAYFPQAAFDKYSMEKNWAFASYGESYLALWCSEPLVEHSTGYGLCELRAYGGKVAWLCIVSSKTDEGSFDAFVQRMKSLSIKWDVQSKVLILNGKQILGWGDPDWREGAVDLIHTVLNSSK